MRELSRSEAVDTYRARLARAERLWVQDQRRTDGENLNALGRRLLLRVMFETYGELQRLGGRIAQALREEQR